MIGGKQWRKSGCFGLIILCKLGSISKLFKKGNILLKLETNPQVAKNFQGLLAMGGLYAKAPHLSILIAGNVKIQVRQRVQVLREYIGRYIIDIETLC